MLLLLSQLPYSSILLSMPAQILDGKKLASEIKFVIKTSILVNRIQKGKRPPGLAVILIGDDEASKIYVRNKRNACTEVGITSKPFYLPNSTTEKELLSLVDELNQDSTIDGILVQLPLPNHIDTNKILEEIDPEKDVDGFHPYNLGRLAQSRPLLAPCTPLGIMLLLNSIHANLDGIEATVVGTSNIVGLPLILELLAANATVTACNRHTQDLEPHVKKADLLISAVGIPGLIKGNWVKSGAIVIDVGMNRLEDGRLVGDVEFASASERAGFITPVPGGVGPMTVACLLSNTLTACQLRESEG